jgi:DNA replication factor GINS
MYECWRKENEDFELTRLPDNFYPQIAEHLRKIKEEMRMIDQKTLKASLLRKELENVKRIGLELIELRYKKLAQKLIKGEKIPADRLTIEERILKNTSNLAHAYQNFVTDLIQRQTLKYEIKQERRNNVLRFLKDTPAIVGSDLKTYGPFKVEDVASLPPENAEILVKRGVAEKVSFPP